LARLLQRYSDYKHSFRSRTVVFFLNEPIDVAMRIYGNPLLYYAGGLASTLLVMKLSALISGANILSLVNDCGRQTIIILFMHTILLNIFYDVIADIFNFPAEEIFTNYTVIFAATLIGIVIPLLIAKKFGRLSVLKYLCA